MKRRAGTLRPPPEVRAALHGEVEAALRLLSAAPALDDERIHAVRQALKRARAALRLLRDAVSETAYVRENACLRDAARPLAAARDARVMLDTLDELIANDQWRRHRRVLVRLRAQLRRSHTRGLTAVRRTRAVGTMRALLESSLERTAHWRLPRERQAVYAGGIRRIYRRGSDALQSARARGNAQALHEWRKQVKYLAGALALVAPPRSRGAKAAKLAATLAGKLGDDHDLAVLAAALRPMTPDPRLMAKLEQRRRKLQKQALKLGRRLYKRSPDRFAARLKNISAGRSKA